jgi:nicotinate-nucleotide adenylyltransferase
MEIPGISRKVHFIEAPLLEISSNLIRKLVSERKPYRYYLPEAVFEIVLRNRLYLESEDNPFS